MKSLDKYGVRIYDGLYTGVDEPFFDTSLGVKRIMRTIIALALVLLGVLALTACGLDDSQKRNPPDLGTVSVTNMTRPGMTYAMSGDTIECRTLDTDGANSLRVFFVDNSGVRTEVRASGIGSASFVVPYNVTGSITCEMQGAYHDSGFSGAYRAQNALTIMVPSYYPNGQYYYYEDRTCGLIFCW